MSSNQYDSNQDDEDAEPLVTTEEGLTIKELPLDTDEEDSFPVESDADVLPTDRVSGDPPTISEDDSERIDFLKKPPDVGASSGEEAGDDDTTSHSEAPEPIDPRQIENLSKDEARTIASFIISVLEEDVADYVEKTGISFPEALSRQDLKRLRMRLGPGDSLSSFNSVMSEILPGEPSRVQMSYEKGVSPYRRLSIIHLRKNMTDKGAQVTIHRGKKRKSKEIVRMATNFTQTLEMVFIPADTAVYIFKSLYPQSIELNLKELPLDTASLEMAMQMTMQMTVKIDPAADIPQKGPDVFSQTDKDQLRMPLLENYYKDEKIWIGTRFMGHFERPTRVVTFADGLKCPTTQPWKYCEPSDRRFQVERSYGLMPAGKTLYSDHYPPFHISNGTFDVAEGYYDPKKREIRRYDEILLRRATSNEGNWIEQNCRKAHSAIEDVAPRFHSERIPGSYAESQRRLPLTKKRFH